MSCLACSAELHLECNDLSKDYTADVTSIGFNYNRIPCCCQNSKRTNTIGAESEKRANALKEDSEVTDPESTGRKRAAQLYPLAKDQPCEWRGLKSAGGGFNPIVGCIQGIASNRHHGPDKNTLNNDKGNVHRICADCHNRWHAANDNAYGDKKTHEGVKTHDPIIKATPEEQLQNEIHWRTRPEERTRHEQ